MCCLQELLHFYWVVRQDEVDAFQWFIHHLADLEYRLKVKGSLAVDIGYSEAQELELGDVAERITR